MASPPVAARVERPRPDAVFAARRSRTATALIFIVVSETEAHDRSSIYRGETYCASQENRSIRHLRIVRIERANAAT